ncbi:MAG TPA: transglutaminase family protein, partial [Geomonas sp.]
MLQKVLWILLLTGFMATPCRARTLVVAGRLASEVTVTQQITFGVDQKLSELTYRFPVPAGIRVPSLSQRLIEHHLSFDPQPSSVKDETDSYGNLYKVVTWRQLTGDARATIAFTTAIEAMLDPLAANAPFPLASVPDEARLYLQASKLVQSADPEISGKAAELTAGAATESAAVDAILNFVTDHIHYQTPPKSYDALFGLTTGTGNCQNYAHLACALLRASNIPARVAVGLTLKDKWKIPLDDHGSSLVQGMGEGLHAWIEVFYPGLGWLPYDPQQSKQFTSTRHIKYAHGPECGGIGTTWQAAPVLPRYTAVVSSNFSKDVVALSLKGSGVEPRGYMA